MSTPISDLPDDFDDMNNENDYPTKNESSISFSKMSYLSNHKDILYVFLAVIAASFVSIESFRYSIPQQVFAFGNAPINAFITALIFLVIKTAMKHLVSF